MSESNNLDEKTMELLMHLSSGYGNYETRKEVSAWTAVVLYAGGLGAIISVVLSHLDAFRSKIIKDLFTGGSALGIILFLVICLSLILIVAFVFWYLIHQMKMLKLGAKYVEASRILMFEIRSGLRSISPKDFTLVNKKDKDYRQYERNKELELPLQYFPRLLLDAIQRVPKKRSHRGRNRLYWLFWTITSAFVAVLVFILFRDSFFPQCP